MTLSTKPTSADDLLALAQQSVRGPLLELEARLRHRSGGEPLAQICAECFEAGGKRLRPLAALLTGRLLGVDDRRLLLLAEAVELTHAATLLHDDVIDEAQTRRGLPAARRRWSNILSVLGGDALLVRALRCVAALDCAAVSALHQDTLEALVAGEVSQQVALRQGDLSLNGYERIAAGKTAALFRFACGAPAWLIGRERDGAALADFGAALGLAFQIVDDLRDLAADGSSDKTPALDLLTGTPSLPLRLAAQASTEAAALLRRAQRAALTPAEGQRLRTLVVAGGAARGAGDQARAQVERARSVLAQTRLDDGRGLLHQLCVWLQDELAALEARVS